MKRTVLKELLEAQNLRKQVVVLTKVQSGYQQLVYTTDQNYSVEGVKQHIAEVFSSGENRFVEIEGEEIFLQVFNPHKQLIIIGAVHISQKLVPLARLSGYECIVIDPRDAFANDNRFSGVTVVNEWPQDVLFNYVLDDWTAFVSVTHDPKIDDPALMHSLKSKCFYIGALGSKKTHSKRRIRLIEAGVEESHLDLIHAPIGLDIHARGPAEISLSIMAEMTACFWQSRGVT